MPKLVVLIGPPGAGKTTLAQSRYAGCVRVNRDDQGKEDHFRVFNLGIALGAPIVIDKMNFNEQQRQMFVRAAREAGYQIHYHMLFVPRAVCLDRMRQRFDSHPTVKDEEGAQAALQTFFTKFEYPVLQDGDTVEKDYPLQKAYREVIISDLDGTLCNIDHRLHWVRSENKKERRWDKFFAEIPNDKLNDDIGFILRTMESAVDIVYVSGRGEETRTDTQNWLDKQDVPMADLYMRPAKDSRPDYLIKEIILDFEILTRYSKVLFVLDDRDSVVQTWRRRGIRCLQVAPGDF